MILKQTKIMKKIITLTISKIGNYLSFDNNLNPIGNLNLPRSINKNTQLQAANPALKLRDFPLCWDLVPKV